MLLLRTRIAQSSVHDTRVQRFHSCEYGLRNGCGTLAAQRVLWSQCSSEQRAVQRTSRALLHSEQ